MTQPAETQKPLDTDALADAIANYMATISAYMAPVVEYLTGYRRSLLEAGFGPDEVAAMAVQMNAYLLNLMAKMA
jgi:hypothetical protein